MAILESHLADRLRKSMQNQCLGFDEAVGATATNSPAGVPRLRYPCRWFGRRDARPGGVVPVRKGREDLRRNDLDRDWVKSTRTRSKGRFAVHFVSREKAMPTFDSGLQRTLIHRRFHSKLRLSGVSISSQKTKMRDFLAVLAVDRSRRGAKDQD